MTYGELLRRAAPPPAHIIEEQERLIWTTKDGRRIAVTDMKDGHIVNCIRLMTKWLTDDWTTEAYREAARHAITVFKAEMKARGNPYVEAIEIEGYGEIPF